MLYQRANYIDLATWHRRRGSRLVPPPYRPPCFSFREFRQAADEDPDPAFTEWLIKVAQYLLGLDSETQTALNRLGHPVKLLRALAQKAEEFWFQPDRLRQVVEARGYATDQLDTVVNILSTNIAISNEYLDAVLENQDRIQSPAAKKAAEQILDITHADQAVI